MDRDCVMITVCIYRRLKCNYRPAGGYSMLDFFRYLKEFTVGEGGSFVGDTPVGKKSCR